MIKNIGRERDKPFSKNLNTPASNLDTYDPVLSATVNVTLDRIKYNARQDLVQLACNHRFEPGEPCNYQ